MNAFDWVLLGLIAFAAICWLVLAVLAKSMSDEP